MSEQFLEFEKAKDNTRAVQFRIDPKTSRELTFLRRVYSNRAGRRVTTGEIVKKLITHHWEHVKDRGNTWHNEEEE